MSCFIGIDAGTSGIKVIVLSDRGEIRGTGYQECALITPKPNWVEQNPEDWWRACDYAVNMAVESCGCKDEIRAIGFSGQMQGCVLLDKEKRLIGNCLIWLDQRAGAEAEELSLVMETAEMLDITGNYCLPSFWAAKLIWIKRNQPEVFDRIDKVLFAKDYLRYKMTGEIACEVSDASLTFLLDLASRSWSDRMFDAVGLPRHIVPDTMLESQDIAGYLKPDIAQAWGLEPGLPVVAGGGDQPVGGVGSGIVKSGIIGSTIGTSGVVFGCCNKPFVDYKRRAMYSLCHSVPEKYSFLGCTLGAGGSFRWMRDQFASAQPGDSDDKYSYMTGLAEQAPLGCEGLCFLPYLNGEATPHVDPDARGVFFGLSYRHDMGAMYRSVMEGVTFSLRDTIEILRASAGLNITEVRAMGGGAKSALWRQIQADVYNASVVTMNVDEGPAAGAAILAGTGSGYFRSVVEGCDAILRVLTTTDPIAQNVTRYNEYYDTYCQLYRDLKSTFKRQAEIVQRDIYSNSFFTD